MACGYECLSEEDMEMGIPCMAVAPDATCDQDLHSTNCCGEGSTCCEGMCIPTSEAHFIDRLDVVCGDPTCCDLEGPEDVVEDVVEDADSPRGVRPEPESDMAPVEAPSQAPIEAPAPRSDDMDDIPRGSPGDDMEDIPRDSPGGDVDDVPGGEYGADKPLDGTYGELTGRNSGEPADKSVADLSISAGDATIQDSEVLRSGDVEVDASAAFSYSSLSSAAVIGFMAHALLAGLP